MILSHEQNIAVDKIGRWLRSPVSQPQFILAGYAGTGKTTLLQEFINQQDSAVLCCAPTGKAASVLQKRLSNARVSTIHRALYAPVAPSTFNLDVLEDEALKFPDNEELKKAIAEEKARLADKDIGFKLKDNHKISPGQLVIVDEASMVTGRMFKDLLETKARVLFVGDPGQLPPVKEGEFFAQNPPDMMLTEIQRQALNSPIVRLSFLIREGTPDQTRQWPSEPGCRRMSKTQLAPEEWLKYDQVITGSNDSRRKINRYFRRQLGRAESWWPVDGEKLICLKNDQDSGTYFINGIQATAIGPMKYNTDFGELMGDILYEGTPVTAAQFYRYPFQVHYDPAAAEEPWPARQGLREFDYAYAITVHKSQGSEWDRVLLADDEMQKGNREFRKRWLYTAVTRAREELMWLY